MNVLGNAAIPKNANEGAGYIVSAQRYAKLYRNATDLSTEEKRDDAQLQSLKLMKIIAQMANTEKNRPFLLGEFKFCMTWIEKF
jgi:hypothetical protein